MNWLNKIIAQTKPMALPFDWPEYVSTDPNDNKINQQHYGIDIIDEIMEQYTADREKQKNVQYLGSGQQGMAVLLPNGNVGKYTNREEEIQTATHLIDNPTDCCPIIYSVKQLQHKKPLFIIEMERLRPLEDYEQKVLDDYQDDEYDYVFKPEDIYLKKAYQNLLECLKNSRIRDADTHAWNLGWRGDTLVLFDLGLSFVENTYS